MSLGFRDIGGNYESSKYKVKERRRLQKGVGILKSVRHGENQLNRLSENHYSSMNCGKATSFVLEG
jgi:hypothetical protein